MNKTRRNRLKSEQINLEKVLQSIMLIREEEQDAVDNFPENLQDSLRCQNTQNIIDDLDETISCISSAIEIMYNIN